MQGHAHELSCRREGGVCLAPCPGVLGAGLAARSHCGLRCCSWDCLPAALRQFPVLTGTDVTWKALHA